MTPRNKFWYGTVYWELLVLSHIEDLTEGSPVTPTLLNLKNVQPYVKLRMSLKSFNWFDLHCIANGLSSFYLIQVSIERYFRVYGIL